MEVSPELCNLQLLQSPSWIVCGPTLLIFFKLCSFQTPTCIIMGERGTELMLDVDGRKQGKLQLSLFVLLTVFVPFEKNKSTDTVADKHFSLNLVLVRC